MLKAFLRPTPGSYAFKKRGETSNRMKESFGIWAWLGLTNLESPHREHGHDGHGHHDYGHGSYGHDSSGADTTGHGH